MTKYGSRHGKTYVALFRDTILTLMGREYNSEIREDELSTVAAETTNYHKGIRCFWLDQTERCHYFTEKLVTGNKGGRHHNTRRHCHRRFVMLYNALNSLKIIARSRKTAQAVKEIPKVALRALKESLKSSRWTFRNKVS